MGSLILLLNAVPEGRLFGLDQQTVIGVLIQLFNATLLAVFLSFILYKPLSGFMQRRSDKIKSEIEKAAEAMAKALEIKESYERKIRIIEHEREEILDAAQRVAAEKSKQMLDDAKKEADAVRERAETDIQKERERVIQSFRLHVIDVSALMAEKLISCTVDKSGQDRLFDETIAELEGAAWPE